jgi:predicted MFS family arabinose efflux permease
MALVGACFSIAFTFGPALGAALANITLVAANPFATAAGFSLLLILIETVYLYLYLPETRPSTPSTSSTRTHSKQNGSATNSQTSTVSLKNPPTKPYTNHPALLNLAHLLFLLPFSGLEFSLPFLLTTTLHPNHPSPSKLNGRLLGFIGLVASLLQGSIVRRAPPLLIVRTGICSCAAAFFLLARTTTSTGLYVAGALLAVTSATVVTGLNSLGSFEARESERGKTLGALRSWGQFGRALGPVVFCSLFWWAGREAAYMLGGCCMLGVAALVFGLLRPPLGPLASVDAAGKEEKSAGS